MPLYGLPYRLIFALLLAAVAPFVPAHEGEDHGAAASAALPATAATRGTASSELFEVVAEWRHGQWLFYVDRYDSNEPVTGATIDIDGQAVKGPAKEIAPGVYALTAAIPASGSHALTITVETANSADLLSLSLAVPDAATPGSAPAGKGSIAAGTGLLVLMLLIFGAVWRYRSRLSRRPV